MLKPTPVILAIAIFSLVVAIIGPAVHAENTSNDAVGDDQYLTLSYGNTTKNRYEATLKSVQGCYTNGFKINNTISVGPRETKRDVGYFDLCPSGFVQFQWDIKVYSNAIVEQLIYEGTWTYQISNIGQKTKMKATFSDGPPDPQKKASWVLVRALCGDNKTYCNDAQVTQRSFDKNSGASLKVLLLSKAALPFTTLYCGTRSTRRPCETSSH
jgi:hypothetical protein